MTDPMTIVTAASAGVIGLSITSAAGLKAWNGWLEIKRQELGDGRPSPSRRDVAELKDRVRRLETIASGIDG
jgi:hypothetical protein